VIDTHEPSAKTKPLERHERLWWAVAVPGILGLVVSLIPMWPARSSSRFTSLNPELWFAVVVAGSAAAAVAFVVLHLIRRPAARSFSGAAAFGGLTFVSVIALTLFLVGGKSPFDRTQESYWLLAVAMCTLLAGSHTVRDTVRYRRAGGR